MSTDLTSEFTFHNSNSSKYYVTVGLSLRFTVTVVCVELRAAATGHSPFVLVFNSRKAATTTVFQLCSSECKHMTNQATGMSFSCRCVVFLVFGENLNCAPNP